jgi:tRNA U34 5-methylaminomethyl-2-thiouridine-forming methyltransferase MnmC
MADWVIGIAGLHNNLLKGESEICKAVLEVYLTQDGSPTLVFTRPGDEYVEKMHHSGGAWTETAYIYLPALEVTSNLSQRILSLGLGLGYNELMACAFELKNKPPHPSVIHSFEVLTELRENFRAFLISGKSSKYDHAYEKIAQLIANHFELDPRALVEFSAQKLEKSELQLLSSFPESLPRGQSYNVLLYDAFSNKMSPELWTEEFLKSLFEKICEKDCVLSTYAATGALKRSLKSLYFRKVQRPGFAGKRDSSFYLRGGLVETSV